jgi:hypothetical protein
MCGWRNFPSSTCCAPASRLTFVTGNKFHNLCLYKLDQDLLTKVKNQNIFDNPPYTFSTNFCTDKSPFISEWIRASFTYCEKMHNRFQLISYSPLLRLAYGFAGEQLLNPPNLEDTFYIVYTDKKKISCSRGLFWKI